MASGQVNLGTYTVPASGSYDVDIFLADENMKKFVFGLLVTYAATAGTTGISTNIIEGIGNADPAAVIGQAPYNFPICVIPGGSSVPTYLTDTPISVTMATVLANQGSPQTKKTYGDLDQITSHQGDWAKFRFTNADATNAATVTLLATIRF